MIQEMQEFAGGDAHCSAFVLNQISLFFESENSAVLRRVNVKIT
jgi:hypothetical protein